MADAATRAAVVATLRPLADRPDADSYSLALIGRALARQGDERRGRASISPAPPARNRGSLTSLDPLGDGEFAAVRRDADARPGRRPRPGPADLAPCSARGLGPEALAARAPAPGAPRPGAPDAHILVGDALGIGGDFAGAAENYRRAANLAFTEPVALRLIEALRRSGDRRPARRRCSSCSSSRIRATSRPRSSHATRLMERSDWAEAIAGSTRACASRLGDNDATLLNNLAWAYAETGDYRPALPLARRAWALDRDNPATADTLGWLLFRSGDDRAGGLALLEQAARGAPSDADIRRRLEQARRG